MLPASTPLRPYRSSNRRPVFHVRRHSRSAPSAPDGPFRLAGNDRSLRPGALRNLPRATVLFHPLQHDTYRLGDACTEPLLRRLADSLPEGGAHSRVQEGQMLRWEAWQRERTISPDIHAENFFGNLLRRRSKSLQLLDSQYVMRMAPSYPPSQGTPARRR